MTLVTVREASEMSGIAMEALWRRIQFGRLPAYRHEVQRCRVGLDVADVARLRPRLRFPADVPDEPKDALPRYFPVAPVLPLVDRLVRDKGSQRKAMCHLAASTASDPDAWERAWCRAKRSGMLTVTQADRWAVALGRSMSELWPEAA